MKRIIKFIFERAGNRRFAVAAGLLASLVGCVRPFGVPPFSQLVAEAPAQTASFRAPDDGSIYVDGPGRPGQPRHLVYSGLIHRAEVVTVDPSARQLLIDGKPAAVAIEGGKSFYQIWYKPMEDYWFGP